MSNVNRVAGDLGAEIPDRSSDERSLGELVGDVTKDLAELMRQEVDLAKAELRTEAKGLSQAGAMFGGAGVAGLLLAFFASLAAMWGLGEVMHLGWAALIVAAVWGVVGALLYSLGRNRIKTVSLVPERTVETLKEDVRWTKTRGN